jgi:hypothetical protein
MYLSTVFDVYLAEVIRGGKPGNRGTPQLW